MKKNKHFKDYFQSKLILRSSRNQYH